MASSGFRLGVARGAARGRLALLVSLALAGSLAGATAADAQVVASDNDPSTTLPATFTDGTGLSVGLCADGSPYCSSVPPHPGPVTVPGNFDASGEAFWMLAAADFTGTKLDGGLAEFALEAAFLDKIAPGQGSAFSRMRFRFDLPAGTYRITHPYGAETFESGGGRRGINATIDTGCPAAPCDPRAADFGKVTSILRWDDAAPAAPAGYIGDLATPHTVTGSPTAYNKVTVERLVSAADPAAGVEETWEVVDETDKFTLEGKLAGPLPAPAPFVGVNRRTVAFIGRRADQVSGAQSVVVSNTGAAPLDVSAVTVAGPDAADFAASGCVGTIAARTSCTVTVAFTGTSGTVGQKVASLVVQSDALNAPSVTIDLTGAITGLATGPAPAPVVITQPAPPPVTIIKEVRVTAPVRAVRALVVSAPSRVRLAAARKGVRIRANRPSTVTVTRNRKVVRRLSARGSFRLRLTSRGTYTVRLKASGVAAKVLRIRVV